MEKIKKLKNNLFSKRVFYTVVFACLMGIDAVVGSQSEFVFQITNNLVGIVFALIILTAYDLKEFLKPFYIIWNIGGLALTIFGYIFWLHHQEGHILAFWVTVPLNIWILGTVVFKLLEKVLITKEVRFKVSKIECIFMTGLICMTLSLNEAFWPLYFLVIFVTLRHTPFSKKDKEDIYENFLDGIILGFIFVQLFAFYNRPYDDVRYVGTYGDCNRNACMYMVTIIAALSKGLLCKGKRGGRAFCILLASVVFTFLLFTGCRSAFIGLIFAIPVLIVAEWRILREKLYIILLRFVGCIALSIFMVPLVYALIRYTPAVCDHPLYYNEWNEDRVQPRSPIGDARYIDINQALDMIFDRFLFMDEASGILYDLLNNDFANPFVMRVFAAENEDAVDSTYYIITYAPYDDLDAPEESFKVPRSIFLGYQTIDLRVGIGAALMHEINLLGHKSCEGRYLIRIVQDDSVLYTESNNPQNFIIYMLYSHGLIFGMFGLVAYFAGLVMVIIKSLHGSKRSVIALMFYMIHFGMGITEIVWIPGQIVLVTLIFMVTSAIGETITNK